MHRIGSSWTNVLPSVYNNSLTHYENVCKLIEKVNECVEAINNMDGIEQVLPKKDDGTIDWGKDGDIAVSNGIDSIKWLTIKNGSEVKY